MTPPPARSDRDLSLHRPNVGVALFNPRGLVFLGRRLGETEGFCWQMPQGGVDAGEQLYDAALRELGEETGVAAHLVERLGEVEDWLAYDFPPEVRARSSGKARNYPGQKQKWYALRFLGDDADVDLAAHAPPEFDAWRWERLERAPELVIPWKRPVYRAVAEAFAPFTRG